MSEGEEGAETDEQLCQVDFAPLGKGNLSVGEETARGEEGRIKVEEERKRGKEVGFRGVCSHSRVHTHPLCRFTSPPSAYRPALKTLTVNAGANCRCASLPS